MQYSFDEEIDRMKLTVRYFTILRSITGKREERIEVDEGSTIEDMLKTLGKKYGKDFEKLVQSGREQRGLKILFFVDGRNIEELNSLKTKINDGSVVALMPPVAGG